MLFVEIVNKIPMSKRLDLAKYSINILPYDNWINRLVRLVSAVTTLTTTSARQLSDKKENSRKDFVLHTNGSETKSLLCSFCKSNHFVSTCDKFHQIEVRNQWNCVKENRLRFTYLGQRYQSQI